MRTLGHERAGAGSADVLGARLRAARVLSAGLALAAAAGLLASVAAAAEDRPLGQIIWTSLGNAKAVVRYQNYFPGGGQPPHDMQTEGELTFRVGGETITLEDSTDGGKFRLMHPCYDFSGAKLLFAAGRGLWIDPTKPSQLEKPVMELFHLDVKTKLLPDDYLSKDAWDAFMTPCADPDGEYIYYVRYRYNKNPLDNGFFLERCNAEGAPDETFNKHKIRGTYPAVNSTGKFLAFCRSDVYRLATKDRVWNDGVPPPGGYDNSVDLWVLDVDRLEEEKDVAKDNPVIVVDAAANRRCLKPTWEPFSRGIAFSYNWREQDWLLRRHTTFWTFRIFYAPFDAENFESNEDTSRDAWDDAKLSAPDQRACGVAEGGLVQQTSNGGEPDADEFNDFWPTFSADGKFLAFTRERKDGSGPSEVYYVNVNRESGGGEEKKVQDCRGDEQLWPYWNQDEDPPNFEVRIVPTDSEAVTRIAMGDLNPDLGPTEDKAYLFVEGANFEPYRSVKWTAPRTMEFRYDTKESHDLRLVLSNASDLTKYQDHPSLAELKDKPVDGYEKIEAVYVPENVRIKFVILAKDDKYRRVLLTKSEKDKQTAGKLEDGPQEKEPRFFDPLCHEARYDVTREDGNRNTEAPYLPRHAAVKVTGKAGGGAWPGISWWIERFEPDKADWEERMVPYSNNVPEFIFRRPNFPRESHKDEPAYYLLRVVAKDAFLNETSLLVPIVVMDTSFRVNTLGVTTTRTGPKDEKKK